jgi:GNAT superfamily N-acetyltransferase
VTILSARSADLDRYVEIAREAQAHLRALALGQWVPAAHDDYRPTLASQLARGDVFKVMRAETAIAFFVATTTPTTFWLPTTDPALYLSGIVVSRAARGSATGARIIAWCRERVLRDRLVSIRIDCHADNHWLLGFYTKAGFVERRRLEQYPGYIGALLEMPLLPATS